MCALWTAYPGRFAPGKKNAGTHWIRGWMNPGGGLDVWPLPGFGLRTVQPVAFSSYTDYATQAYTNSRILK